MTTKEQVKEYINNQFEFGGNNATQKYWEDPIPGTNGTRLGVIQQWMSPEIAKILEKLVGPALLIKRIATNGSNE